MAFSRRHFLELACGTGGLLAASSLTACDLSVPGSEIPHHAESGGQTLEQLQKSLTGIPRLTIVAEAPQKYNLKGNTGFTYEMVLSPGFEIAELKDLLNYLVHSAWSVRDAYMPNTAIEFSCHAGPDPDHKVLMRRALEDLHWRYIDDDDLQRRKEEDAAPLKRATPHKDYESGWSSSSVILAGRTERTRVQSSANRERLGSWPGAVPEFPGRREDMTRARVAVPHD